MIITIIVTIIVMIDYSRTTSGGAREEEDQDGEHDVQHEVRVAREVHDLLLYVLIATCLYLCVFVYC